MNITLIGNKIVQDTKFLAFEKNNGVDVINITVDTDEEWTYKLDVRYPDKCCTSEPLYNIINLTRTGNLCTAIFTSDMLPFAGKYTMQLRAINSDKVQHSDAFDAWVKYSIEPGSTYNPVPSEFYQIEQNITEINNHPPYPDISGFWMIWNSQTNKYELSDIPAVTASDIGAIPVPTTAEVGQTVVVKAVDENGKPTEWEPADFPEQTQSDWNQNDTTAAGYVKNRPFYTGDPVEMVLVEESTVEFVKDGRQYGAFFPTSFNAEFGATYKVSWDGSIYTCVCENFNNLPIIGNQSIIGFGSDTGEPFIIFNKLGLSETGWISLTTDTSASHTISISGTVVPVTKIDGKYLLNNNIRNGLGFLSIEEGSNTTASGEASHVEGRYNIEDPDNKYAHIVGNGTSNTFRSNAYTLDWSGNAWYAGTVEGKALILPSSTEGSTKKFKITVDDSGTLTATEVTA